MAHVVIAEQSDPQQEEQMRRSSVIAALAVTVSLSVTACSGSSSDSGSGGGPKTITIATGAAPAKWDPYLFDWGSAAQPEMAVYDTLIHKNPKGELTPGLATEWSYADPSTFELTLRDGAVFSDGTPVDGAAVKANLDRAKTVVGPKTEQLADIESVEATGQKVTIKLSRPNPSLPAAFSQVMGMVASPKALEDVASLEQQPVGAGPYTLNVAKSKAGDSYTFEKNDKYWDAKNVAVDTLVIKIIPDLSAGLNALRSGQIDAINGTDLQKKTAESVPDVKILSQASYIAALNLQDRNGTQVKALKDPRVRQAISTAIDRDALQKFLGEGEPTTQLFLPGTPGYDKELTNAYPYDPAKAKALLAEAGYPNGFELPVITTDYGTFGGYTEAVSGQLAEVGIKVKINSITLTDYLAAKFKTDNPAYAWFYNVSDNYFDVQQALLKNSKFNPYKVEVPGVEALAEKAAAEQGDEQAKTLKELSAKFVEESPVVVTNIVNNFYFYNTKKIKSMEFTAKEPMPRVDTIQPAG
jgi:peptide/nickel transport system substrate-binding protein